MSVIEVLQERGFIAQMTHEEVLKEWLAQKKIRFYVGFDPTADSLTAGHFLTIMAMAHMQRAGHTPVALFGGATALIGDPTGRTDMRKMLTREEINHNIARFKEQMSKFIDFSDGKALIVNNADWFEPMNYIDFVRDIGRYFTVNRMLNAECYRSRLDEGLTFLEFNYMLMQAYDFLYLSDTQDCYVQMGGDDQWSNIIGGVELIRRVKGKNAVGLTFPLLTTKDGKKMGKSQGGAIWLDPNKTSPYAFYQYFRNIDDESVDDCLLRLTFLPLEEIKTYQALEGQEKNRAKERLAFELTKIVHGEEEALKAQDASKNLFYGGGNNDEGMPKAYLSILEVEKGLDVLSLITKVQLVPSKSEARRVVLQGGLRMNGEKVESTEQMITPACFQDEGLILQKGKKTFIKVLLEHDKT